MIDPLFQDHTMSTDALSPLFSTLVTIYTLVLLYFPSLSSLLLRSSPVVISAAVLCLNILRLITPPRNPTSSSDGDYRETAEESIEDVSSDSTVISPVVSSESVHGDSFLSDESFVEWDVRAPLEVIYEEYDEEDDGGGGGLTSAEERRREADYWDIIKRYASLSSFYPETDNDGSSEGEFPAAGMWESQEEEVCFRWEVEDGGDGDDGRGDGLIEIALDDGEKIVGGFDIDDDNLIEIELCPMR